MFHVIRNRPIDLRKVDKVVKSIQEKGNFLPNAPIAVNSDYGITDGQHRWKASQILKLPIWWFFNLEDLELPAIQAMNKTRYNWNPTDYVYVHRDKEDYKILKSFAERYRFPYSRAYKLLGMAQGRDTSDEQFTSGNFKVTSLKTAETIGELVLALEPYAPKICRTSAFLSALRVIINKVEPKELIHKVEIQNKEIPAAADTKAYVRVFEDIMNYKVREHNRRSLLH